MSSSVRMRVAIDRGWFVEFLLGGGRHAFFKALDQISSTSFQEKFYVTHRFGVTVWRCEAFDARTQATMNVILQARARMIAIEIYGARGNQKTLVNEMENAPRKTRGEIGTEIQRAVFLDARVN